MNALIVWLVAALPLPQDSRPLDPAQALARAQVIEEHEHDREAARGLYAKIAGDANAPRAVRDQAALRLGLVLVKLGRKDEAQAALATAAAAGDADVARQARAALDELQGKAQEAAIEAAVRRLTEAPDHPATQAAKNDVLAFGPRAVAALLAVPGLAQPKQKHARRTALVLDALMSIPGDQALRAIGTILDGADDSVQTAAASAAAGNASTLPAGRDVIVVRLLAHASSTVRAETIRLCSGIAPEPALIARLDDPETEVQQALLDCLRNRTLDRDDKPQLRQALVRWLEKKVAASEPGIVNRMFAYAVGSRSAAGRSLLVRSLPLLADQGMGLSFTGQPDRPNELLDEILSASAALADASAQDRRLAMLAGVINWAAASWDAAVTEKALPLLRHRALALQSNGLPAFYARVGPPASAFPDLRRLVDHALERGSTPDNTYLSLVAQIDAPEKIAWLESLLPRQANWATQCLVHSSWSTSPRLDAALLRAVRETAVSAESRNTALQILLDHGEKGLIDSIANAYELGLSLSQPIWWEDKTLRYAGNNRRGLQFLGREASELPRGAKPSGLSDLDLVRLVESALRASGDAVWQDATSVIARLPGAARRPLITLLARCANREQRVATANGVLAWESESGRTEVLLLLLRDPLLRTDVFPRTRASGTTLAWGEDLERALLDCAGSPDLETRKAALTWLAASHKRELAPAFEAALKSPELQIHAAWQLAELDPTRLVACMRVVLDHAQSLERQQAVDRLGRSLDKRALPELLALLGDADANVRARAKTAIEMLDLYLTQTERWQRLAKSGATDATSAAEALLAQARSPDKAMRLLAIRSLGALGAPETQPFLIDLTKDQDHEVAEAARDALARIHRK